MPLVRFDFPDLQTPHILVWLEPSAFPFFDYEAGLEQCAYKGLLTNAAYPRLDAIDRVEFVKRALWMIANGKRPGPTEVTQPNLFLQALYENVRLPAGRFFECSGNFIWYDLVGWSSMRDLNRLLTAEHYTYIVASVSTKAPDLSIDPGEPEENFHEQEFDPYFFRLNADDIGRALALADEIFTKLSPFLG